MSDMTIADIDTGNGPWLRTMWANDRVRNIREVFGPAIVILAVVAFAEVFIYHADPFALPGLYLYGVISGLLVALVALGMALIYRSNQILNFAQGELGLVPTVLAIDLMVFSSLPYFVAMTLGLAAAILLGGLIEVLIIRRFFKAPRLILTVATIGLSQLLTVAALAIPMMWSKDPLSQSNIETPFKVSFELSPITFSAAHVMGLIIAPIVLAAVAIFLRYTNVGIAVRASAERADRAYLLGIPVKRLQTAVWVIAAVMSFVGVFLRAGISGLPFAANQGFGTTSFTALMIALAAMTLGRFTNLPSIAVSAVALGVLEQTVYWNHADDPALVYPVFGVVILIGLAVRKTGQSRVAHDTATNWQAADEIRPIPNELRRNPEVLVVKWGSLALLTYLAIRLPGFSFMRSDRMLLAAAVVIFVMVGISIVILTGWAGQVSLGQMAFVGVGAAVGAIATREWHLDLILAIPIAGFAGALIAVLVGLPALRVRGLFLAVTTLAFAITASNFLLNPQYVRIIPVRRIDRPPLFGRIDLAPQANMYYLCLAALGLTILAVSGLRRSRTGRVLMAQRENERAAQSYGISLVRAKLTAFAISGFLAAAAGCLFVHITQQFSPDLFGAGASFTVFTSTVVGGLGSMTGALLGALFFRGGTWFLQGNWQLLPSALGVLLVLLIFPSGLGGMVFNLRDRWLRSVAVRHGIVVPSLLADVGQFDESADHVLEHAEQIIEPDGEGPGGLDDGGGGGPGAPGGSSSSEASAAAQREDSPAPAEQPATVVSGGAS